MALQQGQAAVAPQAKPDLCSARGYVLRLAPVLLPAYSGALPSRTAHDLLSTRFPAIYCYYASVPEGR